MITPRMPYLLMAALGVALAAPPAAAQADKIREAKAVPAATPADTAKLAAIRRLFALQRLDSLMLAGIEEGAAELPNDPDMPAGFVDALRERLRRDIGVFVERLVPVYDSLYTASEIAEMLAFYETPLGRRLLQTEPHLMQAIEEISQQWGMEVTGQVLMDLSRRATRSPS